MYKIDFKKPISVHFIGIGGISMSGLAQILVKENFKVSGSDQAASKLTKELEDMGCKVSYPQSAANITDDIDLVVYTAAIHPDNPEFVAVKEKNIPMLTRAELLGQIMSNYRSAINVAGTHGKTTTTSMLTEIFMAANADPTISVGGILNSINGNVRVGKSDLFVTEACEYTNSFLSFNPTTNIILNVKADHLDFFKDLDDIRHSFKLFVEKLPDNVGTLIISSDIEDYEYFFKDKHCHVITFGEDPKKSNYSATNISYDAYGCCSYTLIKDGAEVTTIALSVPGLHNVYNSLAAIAAAENEGIDLDSIKAGLKNFTGTDRRFQKKGEFNGVTVIDDYAHHPDEIKATLDSCKHYPHKTVWCVFQPHTYTRTKSLMDEFATALSLSDKVVLAKIYPARETDNLGISSADLADKIKALGKECYYIDTFEEIEKFLEKNCVNGDLLITMGAGDIVKVGEKLVNNGKN
ncbi:MAG: UDP-N-acetylmuramate--L-alanine ligase [Lachnospira sp.]|nr:UDP-N-acetylmuramate--L-alanine ligase [Lachnospira sp.]